MNSSESCASRPPEISAAPDRPWWREAEVLLVVAVIIAVHLVRLGDLPMRGEETRRVQVAREILQRNDWIVPREQGDPFLSRPPLQNWLIAATTVVTGSRDAWAVRLPSVIAMLLATLLVYGYARTCLSRLGALSAAVAFATMGELCKIGSQAETEALFIALVSGSLLLWHWGQVRGWSPLWTWTISCTLAGLAVLTKGLPQPTVYFFGAAGIYLIVTAQWRRLVTPASVTGVLAGSAVVLAWAIPCAMQTSWQVTWQLLVCDTSGRLVDWQAADVVKHMAVYPFEVFGCMLPWSVLLLGYFCSDLRRSSGAARPQALFLMICIAVAFPTCWLPPEGQTRYLAPLYVCPAVLIGLVIQRCAEARAVPWLRAVWRWYVALAVIVMVGTAAFVVAAPFYLAGHPAYCALAEPPLVAVSFAALTGCLALVMFKARNGSEGRVRLAVLALAAFVALTFKGLIVDAKVRMSFDQGTAITRVRQAMPAGQRLVSLGHVEPGFVYHFGLPIEARPLPLRPGDVNGNEWFCFNSVSGWMPSLPFSWEVVARVDMDRFRHPVPMEEVVIGRRLPR